MNKRRKASSSDKAGKTDVSVIKSLKRPSKSISDDSVDAICKPAAPSDKKIKELEDHLRRLNVVLTKVWSRLPKPVAEQITLLIEQGLLHHMTFKRIVFETYEAILPPEIRGLSAGSLEHALVWRKRLSEAAQQMGCIDLKRAIHKGLHLDMARRNALDVEGAAWLVAVGRGAGAIFNRCQSCPGYGDALNSVRRAIKRRNGGGRVIDAKGAMVQKLAPALVSYWLPFGLWAMSVEDALESLRLFTVPAAIAIAQADDDSPDAEWKRYIDPSLQGRKSVALKIKPKERIWRGRFSSAVNDLKLYRSPSPMVRLRFKGSSSEDRSNPEMWAFEWLPGFDSSGRW